MRHSTALSPTTFYTCIYNIVMTRENMCCYYSNNTNFALTFVDSAKSSVVHLIRAVEDNDILSEAAAHVLDSLCLSGPGRSGRSTPQRHAQGLSQCDVASVHNTTQTSVPCLLP